ncbi:hypothetical protein LYZ86_15450 [Xanthomonas hortorum pv. cynarae]|uniref:PD-(D/E)XK nuclease domain-containing protein n=1 Tax=Xanthomonas hortorum TaxID=56454 RepID=UPI0011B05C00|nr:hypothetical protein [Xanthomonas hortorum]MCE4350617.1 hypothetical protein [Xanthomonas hortorum pv. cynarae]CAD0305531.1 hypothetical protein CFBP2044_06520 [Xanthomonas hortorum pv. cynarae]CAD0305535.1 hypothetical protein CFBP2044_06520 [Xanthomonas hortorum pv. cynarae]
MNLHPEKLLKAASDEVYETDQTIGKLQTLSFNLNRDNDYFDEEHEMTGHELEWRLERSYICLSLLIEQLGLTEFLKQFETGFKRFEGKLQEVEMVPYVGDFYSEAHSYLRKYLFSLSALLGANLEEQQQKEQMATLEGILINTPKIIFDRGIEPKNEAEVRKSVFDLLIHVFPDTVREASIIQNTKTYKPDIGVKSLSTAIEYKFAESQAEVKKAVGGLYEDMRGYAGSKDWTRFYAVIYMTDAFFTQRQIMSEFKHTSADDNWKPLLVIGKGARTKRGDA